MSMRAMQEWAADLRANGRSESTVGQYTKCLTRFMTARMVELLEATEADVVVFLASMSDRGPSRQLHLKALRSFYRWAHSSDKMPSDPTARLHPKATPAPPPDCYSHAELARLVTAARKQDPKRAWGILAAYGLGLRRREMARLLPSDIDFDNRRVYIRDSKGGRSRWVEMSDAAEEALNELRPYWNGTVLGSVCPATFSRWVSEAAAAAGLPKGRRRAHMLRSTYTTDLLEAGARIDVVSKMLGHSTVATTQRYGVIRNRAREEVAAMLPKVVSL